MKNKKQPIKIKEGDSCPDCKKGKLIITLTCEDNTCGCTIHPADGYRIVGQLNKIQIDLLSSFLVGHWKEIAASEHKVAFERILETLDTGALQAVKRFTKKGICRE